MNPLLQKALYVVLTSLGLALIFNFLFFSKLIGISVFIFVVIFLVALYLFGKYNAVPLRKSLWLLPFIIFFSLMPGIRANEFLIFLNVCATFGLLMLLAHELTGTPTVVMKVLDYLRLAILVPLQMLASAFTSISLVGQIHSNVKDRDVWLRVVKGVLMAIPVLLLFGVLFSQADLAFSHFVKSFINISVSERTIQYFALLMISFIAGLSFLSYVFVAKRTVVESAEDGPALIAQPGRGIEVAVFLGLISALFLVFICFQINYLFGGESNILNTGFTYAEYARRGFWELLAVAVLSLLVLLASEKYAGVETKQDKRFLIPALILIAEVIVVIVSAFKRLSLYIDTYSMTTLRFYVAAFIILLLVLFVLLAFKFIKSKPEQFFTFGTLLTFIGFLVVINIVNPDAFIGRSNLEQFSRTGKIDVIHAGELSADAQFVKAELLGKLQGEDRETLRAYMRSDKTKLEKSNDHWQSANLSRANALKLLNELGE